MGVFLRDIVNSVTGRNKAFGEKFAALFLAQESLESTLDLPEQVLVISRSSSNLLVELFLGISGGRPLLPHPKAISKSSAKELMGILLAGIYFMAMERIDNPLIHDDVIAEEILQGCESLSLDPEFFESFLDEVREADNPISFIASQTVKRCESGLEGHDPLKVMFEVQHPLEAMIIVVAKGAVSFF